MTNEIKNVPELRFPEFKEEWEQIKIRRISRNCIEIHLLDQ